MKQRARAFALAAVVIAGSACGAGQANLSTGSPGSTLPTVPPTVGHPAYPLAFDPSQLELVDADPREYLSASELADIESAEMDVLAPRRLPQWHSWADQTAFRDPADGGWHISIHLPYGAATRHPVVTELGAAALVRIAAHPTEEPFTGWGAIAGRARTYHLQPPGPSCEESQEATTIGWAPVAGRHITLHVKPPVECSEGRVTVEDVVAIADSMQPL